jgi:hypothetical protein
MSPLRGFFFFLFEFYNHFISSGFQNAENNQILLNGATGIHQLLQLLRLG